ncbi:MAG: TIGR04133 family radical SAM/SPASM protein [Treponema sp.]|nr:TIGR04133 family radical SAM/SPASM protein [Treponema sp.]
MANFLKKIIFRQYKKSVTKNHYLTYLFWECTLRCNLSCLHCGSDCLKQSGISDMPAEDFIKVLDNIKEKNPAKRMAVCITGGEPLLRNDLELVGKEICKRGFVWGIVTNGMLLTPERFSSLLNAGMGSLSFSLDGLEEQHTYLRQNSSSYKNVWNGIKMSVAVQKKIPNRLVFDVITCVHKNNIEILPKLREELIQNGVKMWRIFTIFPSGRAAKNDLGLSKEEFVQVMDFIWQTRKQFGKQIRVNYACEGWLGKYELKARDYFFFCRGGINVGSVWCDGSVGACLSVRGKDFIQGNVYQNNFDFMDIWNNRFKNMRDRSWTKHGKCKNCKQWKNCLGNGLHLYKDMASEVGFCNYEYTLK